MSEEELPPELARMEERSAKRKLELKRLLVDGPTAETRFNKPVRLWPEGGVFCAVLRGPVGALCGYAMVPEGHPWWGLCEDEEVPTPAAVDLEQHPEQFMDDHGTVPAFLAMAAEGGIESFARRLGGQVQVHGGLTWAGPMAIEGAPWGWWIGFDCGHHRDATDPAHVMPGLARFNDAEIAEGGHVWTEAEVALEVGRLVTAILAAGVKSLAEGTL